MHNMGAYLFAELYAGNVWHRAPPSRVIIEAYARVCRWMAHAERLHHGTALDAVIQSHPIWSYQCGGRATGQAPLWTMDVDLLSIAHACWGAMVHEDSIGDHSCVMDVPHLAVPDS